jgi:putative drug exporter of the RND superfamily
MPANGSSPGIVERLGVACFRRRWRVLLLWVALLVGLSAVGGALGEEFRQSFAMPGSETQAAADRLADAGFEGLGGQSGQLVVAAEDVRDPEVEQAVSALLADISGDADVSVVSPYSDWGAHQISADGTVAFAMLDFGDVPRSDAETEAQTVRELRDEAALPSGTVVELGGDIFFEEAEFSSEGFGLLAAAVILLIAFGSVLAMGLPIATALVGIGCAFAVVSLATLVLDIPPFTPGVIAMIGIGAGIDYALLIVMRYREELTAGRELEAAVGRAVATAGRSILFAGATVVTSLLGLLLIGLADVQALALAAAAGVLFVMLASITLLPALLGFAGRSIDRFGLPHRNRWALKAPEDTGWYRWTRSVQRRPVVLALAGLAVMMIVAAPLLSLRLGLADASNRPEDDTSRQAYDLIADGFGPGFNGPLFLAVELPEPFAMDVAEGLAQDLGADEGVAAVLPPVPNDDGDVVFMQVIPTTGPQSIDTTDLVERLRSEVAPASLAGSGGDVLIGGAAAAAIDFSAHNARTLPWFIGVVLLASFVLLVMIFRSVLVPLKAVAVNLLTLGASYGVVVAVFQWGWLGGVFGLGEPGPIEAWVPMMLFAIVFGLTIDYEVFLMSRVRERFDSGGDNADAVAYGMARTGRLITAAAAMMFCVFGGFALSDERALQMLGLGLAAAILIHSTLVRLVIVPATMQLLGDRNWWLPGWLDRILPTVNLEQPEGSPPKPTVPVGG